MTEPYGTQNSSLPIAWLALAWFCLYEGTFLSCGIPKLLVTSRHGKPVICQWERLSLIYNILYFNIPLTSWISWLRERGQRYFVFFIPLLHFSCWFHHSKTNGETIIHHGCMRVSETSPQDDGCWFSCNETDQTSHHVSHESIDSGADPILKPSLVDKPPFEKVSIQILNLGISESEMDFPEASLRCCSSIQSVQTSLFKPIHMRSFTDDCMSCARHWLQ